MITYHGLSDPIITSEGSRVYYEAVQKKMPSVKVQEFYRLFFAPGLGHCYGGAGPYPGSTFAALKDWVENGIEPETLEATRKTDKGEIRKRPLCPYPKKQYYDSEKGNFYCR